MKKAWCIGMICAALLGLWGLKYCRTNMAAVLPEKSVFFIDKEFSVPFKKKLISTITNAYASSKNPQKVMDDATAQFPEVRCMQVQICQTDKICFYVDAVQPVFLLNDAWVVGDNGTQVARDHFAAELVQDLVRVHCADVTNLVSMVEFIQALPISIKLRFTVEWLSDTDIALHPIDGLNYVLQVAADVVPSEQDVVSCRLIHDESAQKSKVKKRCMAYDLRFKNQIIVR